VGLHDDKRILYVVEQFHLIQLTNRQHRRCIIPQAVNKV